MALITCPECKNKVYDMVDACPHCGRPTPRLGILPKDARPSEHTNGPVADGSELDGPLEIPVGLSYLICWLGAYAALYAGTYYAGQETYYSHDRENYLYAGIIAATILRLLVPVCASRWADKLKLTANGRFAAILLGLFWPLVGLIYLVSRDKPAQ